MFKGRIILVALAVLLIASAAFGQVVKYSNSTQAVGTPVLADGTAAVDEADRSLIVGIVVYQETDATALVANSGIYEFSTGAGEEVDISGLTLSAGDKLYWDGSAWQIRANNAGTDTDEGSYQLVYLGGTLFMIDIQHNSASVTGYDNSTSELTLLTGETVSNVQEAIDALAEASSGLRNDKATGIATVLGSATAYGTEIASLALGTLTNGVPLMVHFAGVFNDKGTNNGAIIDVQLQVDDSPIGETNRQVFLTDLQFYQQQEVTITGKYTPTDVDEPGVFSVNASTDAAYDGGQSVAGELFVWEVSN